MPPLGSTETTRADNHQRGDFMTSRDASPRFCRTLSALAFTFFLVSCDDETPTSGGNTTTTTTAPPTSSGSAFLRAAPLAFDARNVDVVVGSQTISALSYPEVSEYIELDPGEYRVQFFPAGSRSTSLGEVSVDLDDDEAVTVALVGLSNFQVSVFEDDHSNPGSEAGVSLVNTVPDFPAPFDARVMNGPTLFTDVSYLEATDVREVVAGSYNVELLRGGTNEIVTTSTNNNFASGTNYTLFAVGTLSRGDIQIVVASDAP
jgi:Domain of unknown function (DUF4397)